MRAHLWFPLALGLLVPLALGMFVHAKSEAWLARFGEIDRRVHVREVIQRAGKPRRSMRSDSDLQRQADGVGFVCSESMETHQIPYDKADPLRYLDPLTGARQQLPRINHEVLFYYFPFRHGVFVYLSKDDRVERVLFCFE